MPGPATSTMYDLARASLDAIVAHWPDDAELLPDAQFVTGGLLAHDGCELLATGVERSYSMEADPTFEQRFTLGPGFTNRTLVVMCTLLRCVPVVDTDEAGNVVTIPSPAEIEASAVITLGDGQAMFNALVAAHSAGELGGCQSMAFDSWTREGPDGGVGGGTLRVLLGVM
jgi:hypothetical protein